MLQLHQRFIEPALHFPQRIVVYDEATGTGAMLTALVTLRKAKVPFMINYSTMAIVNCREVEKMVCEQGRKKL